ncbi:hypothetical protein N7513_009067 [Penicillium frequentans]|nr:hypothetical protein N7513_009067 [Penicillium glabrum]
MLESEEMSSVSCCGIWRRHRGKKGSGESKDAFVTKACANNQATNRTKLLAVDDTKTSATLPGRQVLEVVPRAQSLHERQNREARIQSNPLGSNAEDYELWAEALRSLKDEEKRNVETVVGDLHLDNANKKGLAADIQRKLDEAYPDQDRTSSIGKLLSVLNSFASVGDVAVSFDPAHAALPWAAVRSVLVILTANHELKGVMLAGMTEVAWLLVRCDTYQQLYMAPDATLRPPENTLSKLRASVVRAYAEIQSFLAFMVGRSKSKIRVDAAFKLGTARSHIDKLSAKEKQLQQAADDCDRHCDLSSRTDLKFLRKLAAGFPVIQDQVQLVLERMGAREEREILDWISPIPYGKHHISVREARTSGTCEWLLQSEKFCEWWNINSSAVLWLQGSIGTGKTFLTSMVIDHAMDHLKRSKNHTGFAYFYCNRNEDSRRDPLCVLQSYVRQLSTAVGRSGHMRRSLQVASDEARRQASQFGIKDCESQLLESVNGYSQTIFVLDALDECEPDSRYQLIKAIGDLVSKSDRLVKVFISSRPDIDIKNAFKYRSSIEILAMDNECDIEKFVNEEIEKPRQWGQISPQLQKDIVKAILDGSRGMFQWAYLQIKQVLDLPTEADIRSRLGKLPPGLKNAYDEIYGKVTISPHAKVLVDRACKWVISACKPLNSDELLSAITIDCENDTSGFRKETDESCLQALCNNLLVLDSERRVWRVTHLSVVEYFENHHWSLRQAHCHAAKVCLRLLNVKYKSPVYHINIEGSGDKHEAEVPNMNDVADHFQTYVRYHWVNHVRTYEEQGAKEEQGAEPSLAELLKKFLGSPNESSFQYRTWYRSLDDAPWNWPRSSFLAGVDKRKISPEEVTIYAMCRFSLSILLRDWWDNAEITFRQENMNGENLLTIAAAAGCKSICETLVKRGLKAKITLSSEEYGRALAAAASRGHLDIARFLVEEGAKPDVVLSSGWYGSVLAAAASRGHFDIVQFLIEEGANPDLILPYGHYGSALTAAASRGHLGMARFLVKKGANPDLILSCGDYGSPLVAAASKGHLGMARLLVEKGANPNLILSSGYYGSALAAAASRGMMDIVRFLVEKGAEPNLVLPNGIYRSALAAAASYGHLDIARFLVKKGAKLDVVLSSGRYGSALAAAASRGHFDIVQFLIEEGANPDLILSCGDYGSPLVAAASEGHLGMARLLVEKGANPNLILSSGFYGSALAAAASEGHLGMARLLVEKGANPNLILSSGIYGSALAAAASRRMMDIVRFLVEKGAEPNLVLPNGIYGSALAAAASRGMMDIFRFLVEKGAEPNLVLPNGIYGSALAAAACEGHIEIVKIFFQNDANATIADSREYWLTRNAALDGHNDLGDIPLQASAVFSNPQSAIGRTPLFLAATNGHTLTTELLLTHRASPYIKDHYGSTAIFAAVRNGHEGVVKCLLEFQDSMDCKDGFSRSLFWWAKMSGNVTIFELLVGYSQKIGFSISKIDLDLEFRSVPL